MKIVLANFFYEKNFSSEEALLSQYYTLTGWAESLQREGAEVIVISRFGKNSRFEKNGVQYHFLYDSLGEHFSSWLFPTKFLKAIAAASADVVHLHHFTLSLQTWRLRSMLDKKTAIVIQHHGGNPPQGWKIKIHNRVNRLADGYFFTSYQQGLDWFQNKRQAAKVFPIMEGASYFNFENRDADRDYTYHDRALARVHTGMHGKPVFLWVGRLDDNKDPLTVLAGFELLLQSCTEAKLYMIYGGNDLEEKVKQAISASPLLRNSVMLTGKIPHARLEKYYDSADYFVLGSHYEGSSYALSEALSCGCIPVVTDIPSLRAMTGNGSLGSLWQPGDKNTFTQAAIATMQKPLAAEASACIDFYRNNLSFDAIAKQALVHYRSAIDRRLKRFRS